MEDSDGDLNDTVAKAVAEIEQVAKEQIQKVSDVATKGIEEAAGKTALTARDRRLSSLAKQDGLTWGEARSVVADEVADRHRFGALMLYWIYIVFAAGLGIYLASQAHQVEALILAVAAGLLLLRLPALVPSSGTMLRR